MAWQALPTRKLKIGDRVLIRLSSRLPYSGEVGIVLEINDDDIYGAILVRFGDSLQFRYTWSELLLLTPLASPPSHGHNPYRTYRKTIRELIWNFKNDWN
jgi:hypothetical protein